MGLFQQRDEEEQQQWAGLPSEPRGPENPADTLSPSSVDPFAVDFAAQVTTMVFPVAPPAPEAAEMESGEPEDPEADSPEV